MPATDPPTWSFLTNYARVLLCIVEDPGVRLRELGDRVGVTERAAYRIVDELVAAGYISRTRTGRRNHYSIHRNQPLRDSLVRQQSVGDLLAILSARDPGPATSASDDSGIAGGAPVSDSGPTTTMERM